MYQTSTEVVPRRKHVVFTVTHVDKDHRYIRIRGPKAAVVFWGLDSELPDKSSSISAKSLGEEFWNYGETVYFHTTLWFKSCFRHLLPHLYSFPKEDWMAILMKLSRMTLGHGTFDTIMLHSPRHLEYFNESWHFHNENQLIFSHVHSRLYTDYLIGKLELSKENGDFYLNQTLRVKFSVRSQNVHRFNACMVILTKYSVYYEWDKDINRKPFRYVVLHSNAVRILKKYRSNKRFYAIKDELPTRLTKTCYTIQIQKMSEVIFGHSEQAERWLDVWFSRSDIINSMSERAFMILPCSIPVGPYLVEGGVYHLYTNTPMRRIDIATVRELFKLRASKILYKVPQDAIFVQTKLVEYGSRPSQIYSNPTGIVEAINRADRSNTITIVTRIDKKVWKPEQFKSFDKSRHNDLEEYNDTGPDKTHLVSFKPANQPQHIDIFVVDRQNHLRTCGLYPAMTIRATHLEISSNRKYVKSTIFTRFEIVGCTQQYSCASLVLNSWINTTSPCPLDIDDQMLYGHVIHGEATFVKLIRLEINPAMPTPIIDGPAPVIGALFECTGIHSNKEVCVETFDLRFLLCAMGITENKWLQMLKTEFRTLEENIEIIMLNVAQHPCYTSLDSKFAVLKSFLDVLVQRPIHSFVFHALVQRLSIYNRPYRLIAFDLPKAYKRRFEPPAPETPLIFLQRGIGYPDILSSTMMMKNQSTDYYEGTTHDGEDEDEEEEL